MSWTSFFNETCLKVNVTIVQDNARCHSWYDEDDSESDDDSDGSCCSSGSSCCASKYSCDADSVDGDNDHTHANLKCRWEMDSCPHSKCCPKLPCRASERRDSCPTPTSSAVEKDEVEDLSCHQQQDSVAQHHSPKKSCGDGHHHHHHHHKNHAHPRQSPVPDLPKQVFSKSA